MPFGPQTGRAIDRYVRMRRALRLAETPALWLGHRAGWTRRDTLDRHTRTTAADGPPTRRGG
jgi:hypothetical protein